MLERHWFTIFCLFNCYISLNLLDYHLTSPCGTVTFSPCLESLCQSIELVPHQAGLFWKDETSQTANAAVWRRCDIAIPLLTLHSAFTFPSFFTFSLLPAWFLSVLTSFPIPPSPFLPQCSFHLLPFPTFSILWSAVLVSQSLICLSQYGCPDTREGGGPSITMEEEKR